LKNPVLEVERMKITKVIPVVSLVILLTLAACSGAETTNGGPIEGSGFVSAREVTIASELSGTVLEVAVEEGDAVQAGDVLLRLNDERDQAQYQQMTAAVAVAEAAVGTAQAQLAAAQVQFELALQGSRLVDLPQRSAAWSADQPADYDLPAWYFQKDELTKAAEYEVQTAEDNLGQELTSMQEAIQTNGNTELVTAEQTLAQARIQYLVAQDALNQAKTAEGANSNVLESLAQDELDAAQMALEEAQLDYDRILSESDSQDILEARAQAALAQTRYEKALDRLSQLQTGEESLQVEAAQAGVAQAEAMVSQAEANLGQARAAVGILDVQLARATIYAPSDGIVLARNVEEGEIISAGSPLFVVGRLDPVELVIYVPEDRYGQVELGQAAQVSVDSFPGEVFTGVVTSISNEAEFTPRNVQTVDGRKSTVYAVKIQVPNPEGKLKPGMPADALLEN
jgi:HlyD family secretion protein